MDFRNNVYKFNKIRRYIGFRNAVNVYLNLYLNKSGLINVDFLKHPFKIRLNNPGDSSTFNEVILRNEYDLNISFEPLSIIDCGANIGLTSLVFSNKYPNAVIAAIEPEENNFALLESNVSSYKNIHPIKSAIWSKKMFLKIEDTTTLSNAFTVIEANANEQGAFESIGIIDIMHEFNWNTIDILKIDIEGGEKEIFTNGFEQWLPHTKLLIVETHDKFVKGSSKALFAAINHYNFSCKLKGFNFIFTNEDL